MARIIQTESLTPESVAAMSKSEREYVYNGLDCCVTRVVHDGLMKSCDDESAVIYDRSMSLQAPILEMGLRGVKIDLKRREEVLKEFRTKRDLLAARLERIMEEGIGFVASPTSPAQLLKLFYGVMGFTPIKKRNANGIFAPTVNRDALERMQQYLYAEPLCKYILAIRDLNKKIGFLKTEIDSDNRIRCNFNVAGTDTGRLASSMSEYGTGTNLQNVDRNLREVFIADRGKKFCNIDLEQADSRNVGALIYQLFDDPTYLDACESGDLHTTVCKMAWSDLDWGTNPDKWRSVADAIAYRDMSYRDLAKRLGHGTNYYGTPRTMAKHSKVPTSTIAEFQQAYFAAFPGIRKWHEWVDHELRTHGRITTLFGRRRCFFGRIPDQSTLRKAIAYCGQSATADEMNLGLINLFRHLPAAELLIQVHDSILFQYPEELEDTIVPQAMELLQVPITIGRDQRKFVVPVDASVGWNWGYYEKWTRSDFEKGKCTEDQIGSCKKNPNGQIGYKPGTSDTRTRKKNIWLPAA